MPGALACVCEGRGGGGEAQTHRVGGNGRCEGAIKALYYKSLTVHV